MTTDKTGMFQMKNLNRSTFRDGLLTENDGLGLEAKSNSGFPDFDYSEFLNPEARQRFHEYCRARRMAD